MQFPDQGKKTIFKTGCFLTFFFMLFFLYHPAFVTFLDQKLYDAIHSSLTHRGTPQPVIVDIDDQSLETHGQWPWSRDLLASLCTVILQASPQAVGIDILLSEPDRTSIHLALKTLKKRSGITIPLETASDTMFDNDLNLARVLQKGPFILACKFLRQKGNSLPPALLPLDATMISQDISTDSLQRFPPWKGILSPLPRFLKASQGSGFVNALSDSDGIIRKIPLITAYKGKFYPNLSLATLMLAIGANKVFIKNDSTGITSISIKNFTIPVSSQGQMLLHFRKTSSPFITLSAGDLLQGKINPDIMKNRIVLIGTSASGLGDNHSTPLDQYFLGVGVHATAMDNILNQNILSRPSWAMGMEWALVFLTGLISTLMLVYLNSWFCTFTLIVMTISFWFMELLFLQKMHIFISVTYPFITLFVNFLLLSVFRFRMEEKKMIQRTKDMVAAQNLTIIGITSLAATRDKETGMHIRRTSIFVKILANRLRRAPGYKNRLNNHTIEMMFKSAPMHDIGKVGVPDAVLLKPGKLTENEFKEIQKHTEHGWHALEDAEKISGIHEETSFLKVSKEIIRCHHEKWDGSGYNQGLKGEEIPLSARLMAVADVYDALTSKRVYKDSFDHTKARDIIVEGRGSHFDPDVVDAFLEEQEKFKKVAIEMADK